jgi:hypothetical protein
MSFAGKVAKRQSRAAKKAGRLGAKVAKKGFKVAKKIHKYANPVTGMSNLAGKIIGGKAGKIVSRGGAAAMTGGMSEGLRLVKKMFKKKNTNVGKAGKQRRRERIDTREGAPSADVIARRAKTDAKDVERFADKDAARTRVNKKITKSNERRDREDTLYKSRAELNAANPPGNSGPNRQNTAAQERTRKRLARRAARR